MVQIIVIALGVEIRDVASTLPDFLRKHCSRLVAGPQVGDNETWLFPKNGPGPATHEIRVVYTMDDFRAALELAEAYVLYSGHSRYGQGPAFGPAGTPHVPDTTTHPMNPWGIHFRMGYAATDTECVGDLLEHSVEPQEFDLPKASAGDFLPAALRKAAAVTAHAARARDPKKTCSVTGAWRAMDTCEPKRAQTITTRGDVPLRGRHFYDRTAKEFTTAVKVGSADLDKSALACRLLYLASCSSEPHFREALQRRRAAAGSRCRFLLTSYICRNEPAVPFLESVLLRKSDPRTDKGMKEILRTQNGQWMSGSVGAY